MSDQEFRDYMLRSMEEVKQSIEEVKRTNERSIEEVKQSIEEVKRTNERSIEEVKDEIKNMNTRLYNVGMDVAWVKGKFEGKQESTSNQDAKSALWIALGSAAAAIVSLIKSFW